MNLIKEMKEYANKYDVPIIMEDGIEFLENYIRDNNVKSILEIGTAIGYSSIRMANCSEDIHVTTVERNEELYKKANENISKANLNNRINSILQDAIDFNTNEKYDLIFIDAAKSQYMKFFEKYKLNLKYNGAIITDNLLFHGWVNHSERIESKNLRQLINKIRKFRLFLEENDEFDTVFYDLGDGIAVSKKR